MCVRVRACVRACVRDVRNALMCMFSGDSVFVCELPAHSLPYTHETLQSIAALQCTYIRICMANTYIALQWYK